MSIHSSIAAKPEGIPLEETTHSTFRANGADLECTQSHPRNDQGNNAAIVYPKQLWTYPRMNKWRVVAACFQSCANGANDSGSFSPLPQ